MTELIGYLGPPRTFTEAAVRAMPSIQGAQVKAFNSIDAVLDALRDGELTGGVVPIENSLEGAVTTTLDSLAQEDSPLVIVEEWAQPVRFVLAARPGTELADVKQVGSIPIASAQCKQWLAISIPDAVLHQTQSTAAAAQQLAENDPPPYDAAICPALAAEHYGLVVLADNIGDNPEASTRFVLVRRPGTPPPRTGADKTTLMLFMREDHPGALQEILTEFAVRGVNLTLIQSRPTRKQLGDYYFSVDCEGHVDDARVAEALTGLRRVCADIRYLGSYPRHDGKEPHTRAGTTDADFADAARWLRDIRNP